MSQISEKNAALCRKDLDAPGAAKRCPGRVLLPSEPVTWYEVRGLADFWNTDEGVSMPGLASDIAASFSRHGTKLYQLLVGSETAIKLYVGISAGDGVALAKTLVATYPGIAINPCSKNILDAVPGPYGGVLTGLPSQKSETEMRGHQIEKIYRGMLGKPFAVLFNAECLGSVAPTLADACLVPELNAAYIQSKQTYFGGAEGNITAEKIDFECQEYLDNLSALQKLIQDSMSYGLWKVCVCFSAESDEDAHVLGNILKSAFSGEDSKPEPVRALWLDTAFDAIRRGGTVSGPSPVVGAHPLGVLRLSNGRSVDLYSECYTSIMNSKQLGILFQLPTKEFPGFFVDNYVEFDIEDRRGAICERTLPLGEVRMAGRGSVQFDAESYQVPISDFSRHALVIGITGGGKTNTLKSILAKLWTPQDGEKGIPCLVIESAKREYWELRNLRGFEDMLLFTLGDEAAATSISYRINPFEAIPGISLQSHIDYLLSTFKAAFELYPPMPYVLETAVYEVYSDFGWDIVENVNRYGLTEYPCLEDLYNKIDVVTKRLGYDVEVQSNVQAALKARIGSLMVGGKGAMLNTKKSVPLSSILNRPVVLELEDIGDDDTKSFVIGMLMVQLYEYRKATAASAHEPFSHLLVVEEAHRLLKAVPEVSEGDNTKAKSVEFFCNMLAEIRTYGQGIIIADQIPTKLAPDTVKNTNLKIVHRTVAADDRDMIGRAMNMTDAQIDYLSSLPRGFAAVYAEGDNRPKCVKMPLVTDYYHESRQKVLKEMQNRAHSITYAYGFLERRNQACAFCERRCAYGDMVASAIKTSVPKPAVILDLWKSRNYVPAELQKVVNQAYARGIIEDTELFHELCYLGSLLKLEVRLSPGDQELILAKYVRNRIEKKGN